MIFKLQNGLLKCFNFFHGLQKWFFFSPPRLQNDLQAAKWPPGYKNDLQNEERFSKTLCKAMGSCKNANRARNHASKEESPLTRITHEASYSISYLLKPSRPIAPTEETMPPKETIRTEAKVLIQPTQEATTDASAPQDSTITWSSLHFLYLHISINNSIFWCLIFWDWMYYWWYIIYRHHFFV